MAKLPLVTVNILSYNRKEELRNTLQKVYEQDYKNIEVIVVDNASSDGTPEMVEKEFPDVILVKLNKNIGIAGWNKGFEIAKGEYILVLDDDSYPEVTTIHSAIGMMNDKTIGIIAFKVFNMSRNKVENDEKFSGYVNNFIGCGALILKEVYRKTGGFNELLFLYSHEIEFAMRTINSGYKIYFYKDSLIIHTYSKINRNINAKGQNSRTLYYGIRNRIIILILYFPFYRVSFRIVRILIGHLFNATGFTSKVIVLKGFFSIVRLLPYLFRSRNILPKEIQEKYGYGSFAGGFFSKNNNSIQNYFSNMNLLFLVNELLIVCGVSKHFYYLLQGLRDKYPQNNYYVICGGGDAVDRFRELGIPIFINTKIKHESRSISNYIFSIRDIHNFAKKNKIDIVHSHHHFAASIARKAAKFTTVKTVLTNHGLLPEVGILNHFDAEQIIAVNEHVKSYLINKNIKKEENVSLIRYGLPGPGIIQKDKKKMKVIAGGRFVKDKGFDIYIKAVSKLPKEVKDKAEFFIAGEGYEELELKKLNKDLNAGIIFLGKINDFQRELYETDIFVMPSRSKAEGFPTVLIEAGFTDNLIIVSNFLGLSEMISEEQALIFEIDHIGSLSDYLKKSILDYHLYDSKRIAMRHLVEKFYSLDEMIIMIFELYQKMLKEK